MSQGGVFVEVQWEVFENDADFVAVSFLSFLEGRTDPRAVRSLEVTVLDQGKRRVFRPLDRVLIRIDLHLPDGAVRGARFT